MAVKELMSCFCLCFKTRLLTGVGRYNEMIYIFDVLKQNHQFELLLGKGMEKVGILLC